MQFSLSQLIDEAWVTPTYGPGGEPAGTYWEKGTPRLLYTPPKIDVTKKGPEDSETRGKATRLFYDFYAMNLLHMWLGSTFPRDLPPEKKKERQVGAMWGQMQKHPELMSPALFAGYQDVEQPPAGVGIVPQQLRDRIEQIYDEVTLALGRRLLAHLRLTLIQEFRYLVTHSSEWVSFRNKLIALYKKNGTITKDDLNKAVATNLPGMKGHEDSVKRLLLFAKYYRIDTPTDDPANALKSDEPGAKPPEEPEVEPTPEPEDEPEPEKPSEPEEPEEPYEEPPAGADWQSKKEAEYQAKIDALKAYMSAKKKLSESVYKDPYYAAGRLTPSVIRAMQNAVRKSGLTWEDVMLGYKNIRWGGAMGGARWGAGVEAFIDLVSKAKEERVEDMAALIDHIYDLEHNTGELLNKGGMYVDSHDLDRRAKVTHIARFLPNVSPMIKRLILLTLKYVSKHPDIEADIHKITNSPTKPFTPEEATALGQAKFAKSSAGDSYQTQAPYTNKKGKAVQRNFIAKAHTNGMYSLVDSMDADVKVFDTFEELKNYVMANSEEFMMPQAGISHYQPTVKQTAKQKYLSAHVRIKLDAEKETALLEQCKMAFRPSETYYKAYLPGDDRFQFFAFSDGTFMGLKKSSPDEVQISNNWDDAFKHCKMMTANALPNSEYEEGKAWIGKPLGSAPPTVHPSSSPNISPTVGGTVGDQFQFSLAPAEIQLLNMLVQQKLVGQDYEFDVNTASHDGMSTLTIGGKVKFAVGKQAISPTGKKYRIKHYANSGEEEWAFANWNSIYYFVNSNFQGLIGDDPIKDTATVSAQVIPTAPQGQLPPNSPSEASYKVHVGIQKPPTHTIRLTAEDEKELGTIGFHPSMVGTDVWYVHSTAKDTVKFYPNYTAKIIFTSQKTQFPTVTKKIPDAIAWLKQHYTAAQSKSPLSQPTQPKSDKGTKIAAIFDKIITDAGFHWDDQSGVYHDPEAHATIKIDPYPKSTVVFQYGNIPPQTFATLPKLAAYLQGLYLAQKKTLAAAGVTPKPGEEFPKVAQVTPLLANKGYTFTGYDNGYVYDNPNGSQIVIQSDGKSSVSTPQGDFHYPSIDVLISYLSDGGAFVSKKDLTDDEISKISEVTLKFYPHITKTVVPSGEDNQITAGFHSTDFDTRHVQVYKNGVYFCGVGKGDDPAYPYEIRNVDPVKKYHNIYSLLSGLDMLLSSGGGEGGEPPATPPTAPTPTTEHEGINPVEFQKIYDTFKDNKAGYVFGYDEGEKGVQTPFVKFFYKNDVTDQLEHIYSLGAIGTNYVFYNEFTKKPFLHVGSWDQVIDALNSLLAAPPIQKSKNELSPEQKKMLEDLAGHYGFVAKEDKGTDPEGGAYPVMYILSNWGSRVWGAAYHDGMYKLFKVIGNTWDQLSASPSFVTIHDMLKNLMEKASKEPQSVPPLTPSPTPSEDTEKLSGGQVAALDAFLKKLNKGGKWGWSIGYTEPIDEAVKHIQPEATHVVISNPDLKVWFRIRRKHGMYIVEERENNKWVIGKEFDTFAPCYKYVADLLIKLESQHPSSGTIPPSSQITQQIDDAEIVQVKDLVAKYYPNKELKVVKKYLKSKNQKVPFIGIIDSASKKNIWAIGKGKDGSYRLFKIEFGDEWETQAITSTWEQMYDSFSKALAQDVIKPVEGLSDEQLEWVETLISTQKPNLITQRWPNGQIGVYDPSHKPVGYATEIGNPLFVVRKATNDPFVLQIHTEDGGAGIEEHPFQTFEELANYLKEHLDLAVQLSVPQTPEGKLPITLEKHGFKYTGTKAYKVGVKAGKAAHIYENPEYEIAIFDNGTSQVKMKTGSGGVDDFDNIADLMKFMEDHFGETPSVDQAYKDIYNYLEYTGFTSEDKDATPSVWIKGNEKITIGNDGSSVVQPAGHPSHDPAAPAGKLEYQTLDGLKHYVSEKYYKVKQHDEELEKVLGHFGFEHQEGSHKGTTDVYLHPASGIMVYTMPNGGGVLKTDLHKVPEAFVSFASTYDLAAFTTQFFEKYKIEPTDADDDDAMDYETGQTGDSELDELIKKSGLIFQGITTDTTDGSHAMIYLAQDGRKLTIHDDKSSSFKHSAQVQSIGWNDYEGLKDFLVNTISGTYPAADTFAKNAGYAGLLKTLANYGFKHKKEIKHQPDEQPYKVFKRPDGAGVTIWDTGVCSYKAASDKAEWEYAKSFAELDDKLKSIYGEVPSADTGALSIMTYEEAKPIIAMLQKQFNVWPKAKKIATPLVEWQYVSTQPVTGGGGEIQVRDHKGQLTFSIGRRADPQITTAWYVRQRVMTTVKNVSHVFTSVGSMINWIGEHIDKLVGFQPIYGYEQTGFKGPGTEFGSTYHADLDLETQFHAAGFHQEMNSLGNLWEHESGFTTQLFQKGITWHWKGGAIEFAIDQKDQKAFLSNVLAKISPAIVTDDLVADIFKVEADKSPTYTYEPSGETYKAHDDAQNAESITLNEHDTALLHLLGFKVNKPQSDPHYENVYGDIFQFTDVGTANYWEVEKGVSTPAPVKQSLAFETVEGALTFAVAKYSKNPFSNADYNENPTDDQMGYIQVNEADTKLLLELGFEYDPHAKYYIKPLGSQTPVDEAGKKKKKKIDPKQGEFQFTDPSHSVPNEPEEYPEDEFEVFIAWNTGNAMWVRTKEPMDIGYNDESDERKEGSIKDILIFIWNRWRHIIWQDMGENVPIDAAQPLKEPEKPNYNTMAQDKVQKMTTLMPEDAKRLEAIGFKFTMDFGYPLYIRGDEAHAENFGIVNDGTAHYTNATTQEDIMFDTVEKGIQHLEAKHKATIPAGGSIFNIKAPENIHKKLIDKGFNYDEVNKTYEKNMDTDYWEKMHFMGKAYVYTYPVEITKGNVTHKKFADADPYKVLNKYNQVHVTEFKDPIQTWQDAVKFGDANYMNAPAEWKQYAPYAPKKSPSSIKASPAFEKVLHEMGFKYTATGIYMYQHPNVPTDWEAIKIEPSYIVYFYPSTESSHGIKYFASLAVWPNVVAKIKEVREILGIPMKPKKPTHEIVAQIDKARKQLPKLGYMPEGPKPHHESAEYFSQKFMDAVSELLRKESVVLFPNGSMTFYLYDVGKHAGSGGEQWLGAKEFATINEGLIELAKGSNKLIIKVAMEYEQRLAENGFGWSDEEEGYVFTPPGSQDWFIVLRFFGNGTALAFSMELDGGTFEASADKKFDNFYNGINWSAFKQFQGSAQQGPVIKGKLGGKQSATTPSVMPFSGFDYYHWADGKGHNPHATIKLMSQDASTMKIMGYEVEQLPDKSYVYKNSQGDTARFFVNGVGEWFKKGQDKFQSSIKKTMQAIWDDMAGTQPPEAKKKAAPKKKKTGDVPYTGYDYSEVHTTEEVPPTDSIELLDDDAETMKQMGFLFVEDENEVDEYKFYYYNQKDDDKMTFHADGTAEYRWVESDGNEYHKSFETVQEAMQYLWDKYNPHIEESTYRGFMKRLLA